MSITKQKNKDYYMYIKINSIIIGINLNFCKSKETTYFNVIKYLI